MLNQDATILSVLSGHHQIKCLFSSASINVLMIGTIYFTHLNKQQFLVGPPPSQNKKKTNLPVLVRVHDPWFFETHGSLDRSDYNAALCAAFRGHFQCPERERSAEGNGLSNPKVSPTSKCNLKVYTPEN